MVYFIAYIFPRALAGRGLLSQMWTIFVWWTGRRYYFSTAGVVWVYVREMVSRTNSFYDIVIAYVIYDQVHMLWRRLFVIVRHSDIFICTISLFRVRYMFMYHIILVLSFVVRVVLVSTCLYVMCRLRFSYNTWLLWAWLWLYVWYVCLES